MAPDLEDFLREHRGEVAARDWRCSDPSGRDKAGLVHGVAAVSVHLLPRGPGQQKSGDGRLGKKGCDFTGMMLKLLLKFGGLWGFRALMLAARLGFFAGPGPKNRRARLHGVLCALRRGRGRRHRRGDVDLPHGRAV